jgi:hypothetical protein
VGLGAGAVAPGVRSALMHITINPVSRGSKIFDPDAIPVVWKEDL